MKLYVVTRRDLDIGQQAVQSVHALREFVEHHPEEDRKWYEASNTIALLTVQDENELRRLLERAGERGIPYAAFREPDRANELTAGALGPQAKKLCRGFLLLGAQP